VGDIIWVLLCIVGSIVGSVAGCFIAIKVIEMSERRAKR
jgi:uncharacterized protein YneF (UPF0154 family)